MILLRNDEKGSTLYNRHISLLNLGGQVFVCKDIQYWWKCTNTLLYGYTEFYLEGSHSHRQREALVKSRGNVMCIALQ